MAQPIRRRFEGGKIRAFGKRDNLVRGEARDHGEGAEDLVADAMDGAVAAHLKAGARDDDHLAIEILEGAETKIAVLAQRADPHRPLIDALYQGGGGRDLKERAMLDLKMLGERRGDDMPDRIAARLGARLQRLPETVGDAAVKVGHGGVPRAGETVGPKD